MVIFHGYVSHNQTVYLNESLAFGVINQLPITSLTTIQSH
jgi:hypothetical protein